MVPNKQLTIFVNGILHNIDGAMLIMRRNMKDRLLPGYYEFPGGKLQPGESLEVAVKRKFLQEVGLRVEVQGFLGSRAAENRHGAYLRVFFEVKIPEGVSQTSPSLNDSHDDFLWYIGGRKRHDIKIAPDTAHMINVEADTIADRDAVEAPKGNNVHNTLIIYTDGGSRGNPGPSAAGYVIMDSKERVLERGGEYLGFTTNDEAEYAGAKLALEAAKKYYPRYIYVRMDSMEVINQMNGAYKIRSNKILPIYQAVKGLVNHFRSVDFRHVNREFNRLADAQVNKILDNHEV